MEIDLKHEIAKLYSVGLTIDQTSFVLEITPDEIEAIVLNDQDLQSKMKQMKEAFIEKEELHKKKRRESRSTPEQKRKFNEYQKQRIVENPQLKVRNNFSTSMRGRLKGNKTDFTFESVGYSVQDLINHLESLFIDGMTWENYGSEWHIDHKTPDSWFSYVSMKCEGFKKSWSLSNLQPLWKAENLSKSNRFASI